MRHILPLKASFILMTHSNLDLKKHSFVTIFGVFLLMKYSQIFIVLFDFDWKAKAIQAFDLSVQYHSSTTFDSVSFLSALGSTIL